MTAVCLSPITDIKHYNTRRAWEQCFAQEQLQRDDCEQRNSEQRTQNNHATCKCLYTIALGLLRLRRGVKRTQALVNCYNCIYELGSLARPQGRQRTALHTFERLHVPESRVHGHSLHRVCDQNDWAYHDNSGVWSHTPRELAIRTCYGKVSNHAKRYVTSCSMLTIVVSSLALSNPWRFSMTCQTN